jgi:hypothetical protein
MARLECTVAHMGFPAATLNKRIEKKKTRVAHQKQLLFSVGMSIYSHIKLEHRICLNNNLKKYHDLGH